MHFLTVLQVSPMRLKSRCKSAGPRSLSRRIRFLASPACRDSRLLKLWPALLLTASSMGPPGCWSQWASACSGLEQGFGSPPGPVVGQCGESAESEPLHHQGPGLSCRLCRDEFPHRDETSKVSVRRKKTAYVDTWVGSEGQSCPHGGLDKTCPSST